jgi:hypothetical protein
MMSVCAAVQDTAHVQFAHPHKLADERTLHYAHALIMPIHTIHRHTYGALLGHAGWQRIYKRICLLPHLIMQTAGVQVAHPYACRHVC